MEENTVTNSIDNTKNNFNKVENDIINHKIKSDNKEQDITIQQENNFIQKSNNEKKNYLIPNNTIQNETNNISEANVEINNSDNSWLNITKSFINSFREGQNLSETERKEKEYNMDSKNSIDKTNSEEERINSTEPEKSNTWNSLSTYLWSWFEPITENQTTNNPNNDNNNKEISNDSIPTEKKKLIRLPLQTRNSVTLVNRDEDVEPIMTSILTEYIRPHLPTFQRESITWVLRYSIEQHGVSLNTLYNNVKDCGPLILAIRDNYDNIFGSYTSEEFHIQNGFFGTRECFLWKSVKGGLKMYPSSGENEYFILCENDFIALGGGDGKFGLYIDKDIQNGHSAECTAFFSEALSSSFNFQIMGLEVWSLEI